MWPSKGRQKFATMRTTFIFSYKAIIHPKWQKRQVTTFLHLMNALILFTVLLIQPDEPTWPKETKPMRKSVLKTLRVEILQRKVGEYNYPFTKPRCIHTIILYHEFCLSTDLFRKMMQYHKYT